MDKTKSTCMILEYIQNNTGFSFYFVDKEQNRISVSNWNLLETEYLSQLAILNELRDNGLAELTENSCDVDTIAILKLSDTDKLILGLPNLYPYEIFVESDGVLTQNAFKFKYAFYDFVPNGTRLITQRKGAILTVEENEYILSINQYSICQAIDEFNLLSDNEKGSIINLKKLSEIKAFSYENGLVLEQFLTNQESFIPEKIKLDLDFNNGQLEIIPTVNIENSIGFTNSFDKLPIIKDVYSFSGGEGLTTRVILSENQKSELGYVKKNRKISDQKTIEEIVDHPELYFDESTIDFDVFYSERVKEIGVYKPKFYPFASPYKSQWIPGIIIKDRVHGEKKIFFKTEEKLSEFIEKKEQAIQEKKETVIWQDTEIPISDAEGFIETAKRQFQNPNKPVKRVDPGTQEVLIIKENAELTEYSNGNEFPDHLKHNFSGIQNLNEIISLKEHQKEGVSWLQSLYKQNFSGGLLADDMGLGKTLQLLYFIEWHSQNSSDDKPYLIVAPVSLLENWENEYQKFFNPQNLPILKLYGEVTLTKENNPGQNQSDARKMQSRQIILTNYETVRSYQISLGLVDFAVIALDEAQKIKTPGTLVTNAAKALKADFKIAMTGTPVENTLVDIWCLMDFAVPGLLGNAKDFAKVYQKPLNDEKTDIKALTEKLRNNIGVFIKRRLKIDVAKDLPTKHDNRDSRKMQVMPAVQIERYLEEIEMANDSELEGVAKRNQKLKSLWAVRDISDHPYLLDSQISKFSSVELIESSSKLNITIGLLQDIKDKNEKVIVFADRRETQKMLQKVIYDTFEIFPSIINGDTPSTKQLEGKAKLSRQQTVDRFQTQDGFNIIIMSPLAAGVGLNVTEANHIIHYSRHWNPAKEEQATDRAYRIGQQKDVFVHYPMATFPEHLRDEQGNKLKSFDEVLDTLLANKKSLASNTLFPTDQAEITPDELFGNIFGTRTEINPKPLSLLDLDKLQPNLFEASIAALYEKQGFEVHLTPYSNDKGVDVVVLKDGGNYLIQAKQTKSIVGNSAIQEICTAKNYYEQQFGESFKLITLTNHFFSPGANTLAKSNEIKLLDRHELEGLIAENEITLLNVNKIESQRMPKI
jgi:SNF2 family DNA or RNA helicase